MTRLLRPEQDIKQKNDPVETTNSRILRGGALQWAHYLARLHTDYT
jgi:hypothetical protein